MLVANPTVLCVVDLILCPNVRVEHWGGVLTGTLAGADLLRTQEQ
jgi:hypothetical protein